MIKRIHWNRSDSREIMQIFAFDNPSAATRQLLCWGKPTKFGGDSAVSLFGATRRISLGVKAFPPAKELPHNKSFKRLPCAKGAAA